MAEKVNLSIKRGDTVVVIAGKDKGKKGKVLRVNPEDMTCIVDGVNMIIKHKKARSAQQKSAREKRPGNIHISNVQILCKCGKATRVNHKFVGDKKVRICKKCDEVLDKKFTKDKGKDKAKEVDPETDKKDEAAAAVKKTLQRREVKSTVDSKVKKPDAAKSSVSMPRKIGGGA